MDINERIVSARTRLGISQSELARIVGVSPQTVQQWESGETSPRPSRYKGLANALHVTEQWLVFGVGGLRPIEKGRQDRDNITQGPDIRGRVPLISWTTAGHWSEIVDNFQPGDAEDWIATTAKVGPRAYALRIRGDSMEPVIPDGSVVIVDPDIAPDHRKIVIVRQNNDEATCKRLVYEGGKPYLKPENPRYPVIEMTDDAVICGVVKQIVIDVE